MDDYPYNVGGFLQEQTKMNEGGGVWKRVGQKGQFWQKYTFSMIPKLALPWKYTWSFWFFDLLLMLI